MTRAGEVHIERLLALTFAGGRLQGGGSVLHVPGIDGTGWWLAFPRESAVDASALAVAPTEDEMRAFVSAHDAVQAFSEETGWLGSGRPPCCRVDLGAGTWVVCFGVDAPPDWIRKLAAASDTELVARMLAAASLSLGWSELAGTARPPAHRSRRTTGPTPPVVAGGLEEDRRPTAVWAMAGLLAVAALLVLASWHQARWPFAPGARQEPGARIDPAGGVTAQKTTPTRPAPRVVAPTPDVCVALRATRPLTSRFCAAVAADGGAGDPAFADRLRRLQTTACGGESIYCRAPVWSRDMIASLGDLHFRLLLSRFAGNLARHLDGTDPYGAPIKPIAPTAEGALRAIAPAVASDPDWQKLWRHAAAPEPRELAREAMASLTTARARR